MTLQQLVEMADGAICERFRLTGSISPMYHIVGPDDQHAVMPAPPVDKDQAAFLMRKLFKSMDVQRYVFVDEAWIAASENGDDIGKVQEFAKHTSLEHYEGRREIIMYAAEDRVEGMLIGRREIIRNAIGPAQLGPLKIEKFGRLEGRFVGLLATAATETIQ